MKRVIKGGTLIDGSGSKPVQNSVVVFENGEITAVGTADGFRVPEDAEVVDVSGRTVIPGLIDCHIHMDLHGYADTYDENLVEERLRVVRTVQDMEHTLKQGVTTVRNLGSVNQIDCVVKEAVSRGFCTGPEIIPCGKILSMTTRGNEYFRGMYREADGGDEVRKAAREQLRAGAEVLKVMATGAVMNPGEAPGAVQFSREEIEAAVEEADKLGYRVAAHAHGKEGIKNAVLAGVRTIEHGTFMDEEIIALLVEHDVFLVPTYVVGYCMKQEGHYDQVPKFMREKEMEIRTNFKSMLGKAVKAGVRIALGTDAGTPFNYHGSNALQLKLYVDDGFFTPVEAIKAGTLTAAEAAGREDRLGSIEPGKQADIVVVDGDCTESLAPLLDAVEIVYKAGRLVTGYTPGGTRV